MPLFIMVCEGRSERAYLQRLQSFLDNETECWPVPLQFIPRLPVGGDGLEQGGGYYANILKCFKSERKKNRKSRIEVWVDDDIYVREDGERERENRASYLAKLGSIPDFHFSFHNFEDFLALHLDDAAIQRWHAAFDLAHVSRPLHSQDYLPLYEAVFPGYRKGDVPPDFITRDSLSRLKARLDRPLVPTAVEPSFCSFAHFLIEQIDAAFPSLLASPNS